MGLQHVNFQRFYIAILLNEPQCGHFAFENISVFGSTSKKNPLSYWFFYNFVPIANARKNVDENFFPTTLLFHKKSF